MKRMAIAMAIMAFFTCRHGTAAPYDKGLVQLVHPVLIAQSKYCYICGQPLINDRCPNASHNNASGGSSSSGRRSGGSASGGGESSVEQPAPLPTPFQLQKQQQRNKASSFNEQGIQQLNERDPDGAVDSFTQALNVYPDFDDERQKIVDNLALARSIIAQRSQAAPPTGETAGKAKRLITKLLQVDGTCQDTKLPLLNWNESTPPAATANAGAAANAGQPAAKLPGEETKLPEPPEWAQMGDDLAAIMVDPSFSELDKRVLSKEYRVLFNQFGDAWDPLSRTYHKYLVAQDERERLRVIIEQHNLHKPAPGAPVQEWNDEMRMLVYEIEQCEKNIARTKAAFDESRAKNEPAIEAFLKSPRFISFKQQVAALRHHIR